MKNKKKKYLPLYYEWMETGVMPDEGLCVSIHWCNDMELFSRGPMSTFNYWANNGNKNSHKLAKEFNPIRQNILLFIAAMNNEL